MPTFDTRVPWEVLVVDDDEGIRELIVSYFNTLDIPVTSAHDGRAAIAALHRSGGRYGMVVTDLNLPGADGFAVLQAARQANPQCYVVIVTGYASLDSAIRAVRVGAYDYMTKPFSMGQLDVVLKRITDRISLEKSARTPGPIGADDRPVPPSPGAYSSALEQAIARIEATLVRIETQFQKSPAETYGRR